MAYSYIPEISKPNFSDYAGLSTYNKSTLGIPVAGSNDPNIPMKYYQVVPVFKGFNYDKPNYNSLTLGSCCNNYPGINQGYDDGTNHDGNCVKYVGRPCTLPPAPKPYGPIPHPKR
jgi:hypothetical protein